MLVLGIDAGGTGSRAVLVRVPDGEVVGRGSGGPGNPVASPDAAHEVGRAARAALAGHEPAGVAGAVLGVAGTSVFADPTVSAAFGAAFAAVGLAVPVPPVGDVVTAFAAGSACDSGAVLIAGTGAIAAHVPQWTVGRTVDGWGWLLGDEGSGFWIGRRAVRAAVRDPGSALGARVHAHAGASTVDELVRWATVSAAGSGPPPLAGLAPLVCALARGGEPAAARIVDDAAGRLVATLDALGPVDGPVVLAGSLLTRETPVRAAVCARLDGRDVRPRVAGDPALAAAWLAARPLLGTDAAAHLHATLLP
ncbi:N-acetylglucosamine kinase [Virgisporangium aliadipatigenens]|uniref:N-acetylglucosamine kinase n=1 Tax=Virgisporangium aliadipatigenens TaxID=741659 RepID=A0A8J3YE25_9ACTN|nr:BadF/BadG/BcrA/BcrD ATPase family protein [Virgisporangium aliadipatigenens]GIJ43291.1 N-acetylglucosamine kinase [Virgisporangium aliadipatigenens]